jgi:hypothetical protein
MEEIMASSVSSASKVILYNVKALRLLAVDGIVHPCEYLKQVRSVALQKTDTCGDLLCVSIDEKPWQEAFEDLSYWNSPLANVLAHARI